MKDRPDDGYQEAGGPGMKMVQLILMRPEKPSSYV